MASNNNSSGESTANDNSKLDIGVINNGVKLLGEVVLPGASLLMEDHIPAGLTWSAAGLIGGAAFGRVFGPLGYILARYGASAASFSQSLEKPPVNGQKSTKDAVAKVAAQVEVVQRQLEGITPMLHAFSNAMAPAFSPAVAAAPAAAAPNYVQAEQFKLFSNEVLEKLNALRLELHEIREQETRPAKAAGSAR